MFPYVLAFALTTQMSAPVPQMRLTGGMHAPAFAFGVVPRAGAMAGIDLATLRRSVKGYYPTLDLDSVDKTRTDAVMVLLLFDRAGNVVRHAQLVRKTDRMFALDVLNAQFKTSLTMADVKQTGIAALTGPRDGVVPGTVWVCWGELRR